MKSKIITISKEEILQELKKWIGSGYTKSDIISMLDELDKKKKSKKVIKKSSLNIPEENIDNELYNIYIDGASRGNPGEGGGGIAIYDSQRNLICEISEYYGKVTNNEAEYNALISALKFVVEKKFKHIFIFSDSKLLVKQVKGEYRVRSNNLKKLYDKAMFFLKNITKYNIKHIPREENKEADKLANIGINKKNRMEKWIR